MKLVLMRSSNQHGHAPGLLIADEQIVDISDILPPTHTPQLTMQNLIDGFEKLRPQLEQRAANGDRTALASVRLMAPLPHPKILCCIGNYREHQTLEERPVRPLNMFLKSSDAVIGPSDTVVLPKLTEPYLFQHEAELGLVFKGPAKDVSQENWRDAIFGYTAFIDVTARGDGRQAWRQTPVQSWIGKQMDTFAPIGPCIVTADEIPDPQALHVRFWNNGEPRHDYKTDDMEHKVPELVEFATACMTMKSGDVLACGTNHEGLGAIQNGDVLKIDISGIGAFSVNVVDPLNRRWERGIYMGRDSVAPEARRARQAGGA